MWWILVASLASGNLSAQLVPDMKYKDFEKCQEHVDWGKKTYPKDYADGTIAVCIFKPLGVKRKHHRVRT